MITALIFIAVEVAVIWLWHRLSRFAVRIDELDQGVPK